MILAPLLALTLAAAPALPKDAPTRDRWLAPDKAEHVAASFVAGGVVYLMAANDFGVEKPERRAAIAFGFAVGLGAGKELVWDLAFHNGDPSWKDFTADVVGATLSVGLCYLIDRANP
jgi:uncharacterized protein YfiM (DUF2279 family)